MSTPEPDRRGGRRAHLGVGVGGMLLGLYPERWRERYRSEMLALLDDDPPTLGGLATLLSGALDAHIRPRESWGGNTPPATRLRLTVGALFACWMAMSLAGADFQKTTEEQGFRAAGAHHPLLAAANATIIAGAALGAGAIAVGGLPLLRRAIRAAYVNRDGELARLLSAPALAIVALPVLARMLFALAPARDGHFPVWFALSAGAPLLVTAAMCAGVCGLTPRTVLRRIEPSPTELRRAYLAGIALALAMCAITCALLVYEITLCVTSGALASEASGPLGASVATMLAGGCALAAASTAAALVSATRARGTIRSRG